MSNPTIPVRLAAASALSAGALLMTVSPALGDRAPEPNYAGPSTVLLAASPDGLGSRRPHTSPAAS